MSAILYKCENKFLQRFWQLKVIQICRILQQLITLVLVHSEVQDPRIINKRNTNIICWSIWKEFELSQQDESSSPTLAEETLLPSWTTADSAETSNSSDSKNFQVVTLIFASSQSYSSSSDPLLSPSAIVKRLLLVACHAKRHLHVALMCYTLETSKIS